MTREERSPVYAKAIDTFGIPAQLQMVIEEMSELTKELCKFSRGKEVRSQIAEETADVLVCLDQLMMIFGIRDEVEAQMDRKVLRLAQRLHMQELPKPAPMTCDPIDRQKLLCELFAAKRRDRRLTWEDLLRIIHQAPSAARPEEVPMTLRPGQEVWIVTPDYKEHSVTLESVTVASAKAHSLVLLNSNGLEFVFRWEDLGETVFRSFEAAEQRLQELSEEV